MKIEILEGKWKSAAISEGVLRMINEEGKLEKFSEVKHLEIMTEEKKKEYKRKIGYGVAIGLVTFGVGGLVAGLAIGNKEFVEFYCELPDDKGFMGKTQKRGYIEMTKLLPGGQEEFEKENPVSRLIPKT